ncbi:MAG: hypothetical protein MHM6MM_004421 [Cercozoa sp. M6MM]
MGGQRVLREFALTMSSVASLASVSVPNESISRSVSFPDTPSSVLTGAAAVEVAKELNLPTHAVKPFGESDGVLSAVFVAQWSEHKRVFVKTPPTHDFLHLLCREQQLFKREAACLRQCAAKEAEKCATLYVPHLVRESASCLAMHHLGDLGFSNVPEQRTRTVRGSTLRTPLSFEHARQALTALAEFHALFFDDESVLSEFDKLFSEEAHRNFIMSAFDDGVADLKRLERKGVVQADVVASVEQMRGQFDEDNAHVPRTCFLIHGDLWSPNLMWRANRVAFVDFQWTKRGEPLHDVYYLLFSAMETEARRSNFEALLEHYVARLLSLISIEKHKKALQFLRGSEQHARAVRQTTAQLIAGGCDLFLSVEGEVGHEERTGSELESRFFAMLHDLGKLEQRYRRYTSDLQTDSDVRSSSC